MISPAFAFRASVMLCAILQDSEPATMAESFNGGFIPNDLEFPSGNAAFVVRVKPC